MKEGENITHVMLAFLLSRMIVNRTSCMSGPPVGGLWGLLGLRGEKNTMKVYMIMTATGPVVVLTSYSSPVDPNLVVKLANKGVTKYAAYEIQVDLARERYGQHYFVVEHDAHDDDYLRILDENGVRMFGLFRFSEMGPPVHYEAD